MTLVMLIKKPSSTFGNIIVNLVHSNRPMKPELRQEVDDMVSGYTTLILGTNMFKDTFYMRGDSSVYLFCCGWEILQIQPFITPSLLMVEISYSTYMEDAIWGAYGDCLLYVIGYIYDA